MGAEIKAKNIVYVIAVLLFSLLFLEISCQILHKAKTGHWLWLSENQPRLFEPHSWLAGVPRKSISVEVRGIRISHDEIGTRLVKTTLKVASDAKRIIVFEGSSTYGTRVSDEQTWPSYLQETLGPSFKVINAGVPGYSTAENIIQTALQSYDLQPDIAIYYMGWNDVRNLNIKNLKSDYSDFHGPSQFFSLQLLVDNGYGAKSALIYYLVGTAHKLYQRPFPVEEISRRAIDIYKYNIKTLISIARAHNIQIILVPQILNYSRLTDDKTHAWIPFIKDSDLREWMGIYNDALLEMCRIENVSCFKKVLDATWEDADFVDKGHFSGRGGAKFAQIIYDSLMEYSGGTTSGTVMALAKTAQEEPLAEQV
ncbi:MAG: GDSL-type esterase/lipase family protein [Candidatus Omnitrophota bacterium]|nr:GDSL-type esterase/lipase family protein [Candidatus Omnitrophota bacterium]